jgi:CheY-like chemotaxis protein
MNHPQGGAMFRVLLPASAASEDSVESGAARPAPISAHVLLVDDELAALELAREALTGAGAEVVAASSGEQAIRRLQNQHFDLVLLACDMDGPWNGPDIYRWMAANRRGSEANIVLVATDIQDPELRDLVAQGRMACLKKPLQVPELLAATNSRLSMARAAAAN